jgi:hypothetical protein
MPAQRFLLAVILTATSTAFAQVSIASQAPVPDSPQARALQAFKSAPMRRAGNLPAAAGTVSSYNWSGFAVTGTDFTEAKGSWIVPTVTCTKSPNGWAAEWVGIDGYSSSTVEQTGTLTWCDHKTANYYSWYEFYPAGLQTISTLPVSPGDTMSASVTYNGSKFVVKIEDETTGKSFSISQAVSGAVRSSAEWIAEAPEAVTGVLNLADFTKAEFGTDYTSITGTNSATDSTVSGVIKDFGSAVEAITQVDDTDFVEAHPSALSADGSSFVSNWIEFN